MKKSYAVVVIYWLTLTLFNACSYLPEEYIALDSINIEETPNYIALTPAETTAKQVGILFYPGGLVDPHAYIPMFQNIVNEQNHPIVILKVAANLAITNTSKGINAQSDFEEITDWVIGGHSLGGAVAGIDVSNNPDEYKGLFLLGAYTTSDLSDWNGAALSLYGEFDELLDQEKFLENESNLPTRFDVATLNDIPDTLTTQQTIYHEIKGGNHAYFGNYGEQEGDGTATINRTEQQAEVAQYLQKFLEVNALNY